MRQTARILGWTITILTILIFSFLGVTLYSLARMVMYDEGFKIGEISFGLSDEGYTLSIPLTINNTSYLEISDLNIISYIKDSRGIIISNATTMFGSIPRGYSKTKNHTLSLNINDILGKNLTYLLFSDSELKIDTSISMRYANIFSFKMSIKNITIPWIAPIGNFSVGRPKGPYPKPGEPSTYIIIIPVSFINRSPFRMNGTLIVKLYNNEGVLLGEGSNHINIKPATLFIEKIKIELDRAFMKNYTGSGYIQIYFRVDGTTLKLMRVNYG